MCKSQLYYQQSIKQWIVSHVCCCQIATVYGRGVYFAVDASYSDRYATPDAKGVQRMYLTKVLTGEYTKGQRDDLAPPVKNPQINGHILFDSLVDNTAAPTIFVVFGDAQAYPAYLITYH